MDDLLGYVLDLRLRTRGRRVATAIVDRCLGLIARAELASPAELAEIEVEVADLRAELAARFGPRDRITAH